MAGKKPGKRRGKVQQPDGKTISFDLAVDVDADGRGRFRRRGAAEAAPRKRTLDDDLADALEIYCDPRGRTLPEILLATALGHYQATPIQLAATKLVFERVVGKARLAPERKERIERVWSVLLGEGEQMTPPDQAPRDAAASIPAAPEPAPEPADAREHEGDELDDLDPAAEIVAEEQTTGLDVADGVSLEELTEAQQDHDAHEPLDVEFDVLDDDTPPGSDDGGAGDDPLGLE